MDRISSRLSLLCLSFVLSLVAACGGSEATSSGDCASDLDCAGSLRCVAGACVEPTGLECDEANACPEGYSCNAGSCAEDAVVVTDADTDGIADSSDNCPTVANPDQADADADDERCLVRQFFLFALHFLHVGLYVVPDFLMRL